MKSISILMPVYNGARYLPEAIASVLAQTRTDLELVVVDDGSTDASLDIIRRFERRDGRVRVVSRPNTGIVGALADAVSVAEAPLLARLDADDIAVPDRLERQAAFLDAHPGCVAVGSGAWIVDSDGAVVDRYAPPLAHGEIERELLRGNGGALIHPSAVFRRSAFEKAGGYDPAFCKAEDIDLYFRLMAEGHLANLPEALIYYRQHTGSANFTARAEQRRLVGRILERESARRQLAPGAPAMAPSHADIGAAARHRQWACTSCRHGSGATAVKHALLALRSAPAARENWTVLRYVLGCLWARMTGRGSIAGAAPAPSP
jgi:glycosyltransferase involved in cell wall biosynthesis